MRQKQATRRSRSALQIHPFARPAATGAAALLAIAIAVVPATAAQARVPAPTNVHVVGVAATSFKIGLHISPDVKYRVYVSTNKGNLWSNRLKSARRSKLAAGPQITIRNLHYTTKPYYFRVMALNGKTKNLSKNIKSVGLRPVAPTNVQAFSSSAGTYLTWSSAPATGFAITQSTDPGMSVDRKVYTIRGTGEQFTPYGLVQGTTYYFTVRALNARTPSSPSPVVSTVVQNSEQPVRVMTFNVTEAQGDGTVENGQKIAPWSQRKVVAANLINQGDPDVIAVQEAASWTDGVKGPRQIDSLRQELGGTYALADTEVPPSQKNYFRTGCYILYKPDLYQPIGAGGHWDIGDTKYQRYAAYQILQNRASGAEFLFVSPHLEIGSGASFDALRETETQSMLDQANALASQAGGIPVVYAGDFNSHSAAGRVTMDGPGTAMQAAHNADAFQDAQTRINPQYDSSNQYMRTPPQFWESIDHVYTTPGTAIESWDLILDLVHGQFVGVMASDHNPLFSDIDVPYVGAPSS